MTYDNAPAYVALSFSAMERAVWLHRSAHAAKYEGVHGAPSGLAPDVVAAREALLTTAAKILAKARDREMDLAVAYWKSYRTMEPPNE